jgi:hypothetical protein
MSTQTKRRPVPSVTAEERAKWLGKVVTTSHVRSYGKRAGETIVREYRVSALARFGPDGDLKLEVGGVDTPLGRSGMYISAADATLK